MMPRFPQLKIDQKLDKLTVDQLHGIFTAYEMRTGNKNHQKEKQPLKHLKQR
jgi:hypothetical protein